MKIFAKKAIFFLLSNLIKINYFPKYTIIKNVDNEDNYLVTIKENFLDFDYKYGHSEFDYILSDNKTNKIYRTRLKASFNLITEEEIEYINNNEETLLILYGKVFRNIKNSSIDYSEFYQVDFNFFGINQRKCLNAMEKLLNTFLENKYECKKVRDRCIDNNKVPNYDFPHAELSSTRQLKIKNIEVASFLSVKQEILKRFGINKRCWSFGLGLDRLIMIKNNLTDIKMLHEFV